MSPLAGKLPFRKGSGAQPHSSGQSMSRHAQELDVARQEVRAGKREKDGASCTKSLLLVGSFCWQGSERAQAGGAVLRPPAGRCNGSMKHFQLGTQNCNCKLHPRCSGVWVKPISQLILTTGFCEATILFWGNVWSTDYTVSQHAKYMLETSKQ